jgi:hypothetical protein
MNYIFALAIWVNIGILHQRPQAVPVGVYISETLYRSVPTKDGKGFTYKPAVKVEGKFRFIFYKDRILLHTTEVTKLIIDSIDNRFREEAAYFVHDRGGKSFLVVLVTAKKDKKICTYIDYYTIGKGGKFSSHTKIFCRSPVKPTYTHP